MFGYHDKLLRYKGPVSKVAMCELKLNGVV